MLKKTSLSKEYSLAEKRWEDAYALADACLSLYDEGMTVEDIALVMRKNKVDVESNLKLARAFPPGQRWKNVPITVYQALAKYPDPQKMLAKAWNMGWYATDLNRDFNKFRGEGFPIPVPAKTERQTPIEILLGVDEEGMTTARKLYAFLELRQADYSRWVRNNIEENNFSEEGEDYLSIRIDADRSNNEGSSRFNPKPTRDYLLNASFAKKLAMASQTKKGEEAREYFIRVEQNAKAFANGSLNCISPQGGAMRPDEAAQLILETADQFKNHLSKTCLEKMITTALELKGTRQVN